MSVIVTTWVADVSHLGSDDHLGHQTCNTDVHYLSHLVTFEVLPHESMVSHVVTHDLTCTWLRGDSWGGLYICCRLTLHLL